jgi:hypothetical protein
MHKFQKINITVLLLLISVSMFSQENKKKDETEIKKDVTVIKSYQPTVQDVSKINSMPVFNDTALNRPKFLYSISSSKLNPAFQPRPVSAAKMVQEPIDQLYKSYLKLGLGNKLSPLAEISINNLRSHENSFGVFLRHYSANGKVKLENDKKVDALFADNEAELYGKHIFKSAVISGNMGYLGNKVNYYGYNPDIDTSLNKSDILQKFNLGKIDVNVESNNTDSDKLYYKARLGYKSFSDNYDNSEGCFSLGGAASKTYTDYYVGGNVNFEYYTYGGGNDSMYNSIFTLNPWFSKSNPDWKYIVGFTVVSDVHPGDPKMHFYPLARLDFNVVPNVLSTYIGLDGNLKTNSYLDISNENPYVIPGLLMKPANCKINIYGGIKGAISDAVNYNLLASYKVIEDEHFYVNDSVNVLGNQFLVVYDDIEKLNITAELEYSASKKFALLGKIGYNKYSTIHEAKAWHLPEFEGVISARYNLRDKILAYAEFNIQSGRYAKQFGSDEPISLKPVVDLNLKLEYRYSKVFSVFAQCRNLTASKYSMWNQYPGYSLQLMAGLTYSL